MWLYRRFALTFGDIEDPPAERGITVSYEAIRLWRRKFGSAYARASRRRDRRLGDIWHLNEVFETIQLEHRHLWRPVDQDGEILTMLSRDRKAAKRFSRKILKRQAGPPLQLVRGSTRPR